MIDDESGRTGNPGGQIRAPVRPTNGWPHETKFDKRCFELLRAAYVKARYSRHYRITEEELAYLTARITLLREIATEASQSRIAELRALAEHA